MESELHRKSLLSKSKNIVQYLFRQWNRFVILNVYKLPKLHAWKLLLGNKNRWRSGRVFEWRTARCSKFHHRNGLFESRLPQMPVVQSGHGPTTEKGQCRFLHLLYGLPAVQSRLVASEHCSKCCDRRKTLPIGTQNVMFTQMRFNQVIAFSARRILLCCASLSTPEHTHPFIRIITLVV